MLDEVPAPRLQRPHVAGEVAGVDVGGLAELGAPRRASRGSAGLEVAVGAERRDRPAPTRSGRRRARRARTGRRTGRRWWPARRSRTARRAPGGGRRRWPAARRPGRRSRRPSRPSGRSVDVEDVGQLGLEPAAHRRAAVDVPVRAEQPPHLPGLRLRQAGRADPERVQPDPAGVQQPGHVVVGGDEQRGRIGERLVVEQQPGVDVAVRGDDRQLPNGVVQPSRDRADAGVGGK